MWVNFEWDYHRHNCFLKLPKSNRDRRSTKTVWVIASSSGHITVTVTYLGTAIVSIDFHNIRFLHAGDNRRLGRWATLSLDHPRVAFGRYVCVARHDPNPRTTEPVACRVSLVAIVMLRLKYSATRKSQWSHKYFRIVMLLRGHSSREAVKIKVLIVMQHSAVRLR